MPRKLKTYITNLGFFELAIAAPSMKAALEAWGMSHNTFQHGFAKETDDPAIVAAATANPGIVLKRAIGSKGAFQENAELPASLPNIRPAKIEPRRKAETPPKPKEKPKAKPNPQAERAAILSFEKAKAARDKKRVEEEKRIEAERQAKRRVRGKAEAALEQAREEHETTMAAIEREREKLDRRAEKETERWETQRKKLSAAIDKAQT